MQSKKNKKLVYMYKNFKLIYALLVIFSILIIISLIITNNQSKEPFNTYFRQTVRPQVRNFRDAHEVVTYHFDTKFRDFRKSLGIY